MSSDIGSVGLDAFQVIPEPEDDQYTFGAYWEYLLNQSLEIGSSRPSKCISSSQHHQRAFKIHGSFSFPKRQEIARTRLSVNAQWRPLNGVVFYMRSLVVIHAAAGGFVAAPEWHSVIVVPGSEVTPCW